MSIRKLSRRDLLKGSGALVVSFSLAACSSGGSSKSGTSGSSILGTPGASPSSSMQNVGGNAVSVATPTASPGAAEATPQAHVTGAADQLDSWLAIQKSGVTVYVGKVELGQGITTSLTQIVADELDVPFDQVTLVEGNTPTTPNQGYTAGSQSIQSTFPVLQSAAATARQALLQLASNQLNIPADQLVTKNATVQAKSDSSKSVSYGDLIGGQRFNKTIDQNAPTKQPSDYTVIGKSIARVDIPPKLTGAMAYLQNLRLDGMLHGRIIRPWILTPSGINATIDSVDESSISSIPGIVKVVRKDNFLGVVAEREEQAIEAARTLKVTYKEGQPLLNQSDLFGWLRQQKTTDKVVDQRGDVGSGMSGAAKTLKASYNYPYQSHGSIGPSCCVADVRSDRAIIYAGTQGPYPLRDALAALLGMQQEQVELNYIEASGCYGHNGADDVCGDAALLSQAVGKPVRLQWMRQDEFAFEPHGPAMAIDVQAGLDGSGKLVAWDFGTWTPTHSTRPSGQAGNLIAGMLTGAPTAKNGAVGGDRNAPINYGVPNYRVTAHWMTDAVLRPSALRSLGAFANVFANESFIDELAAAAGVDPIQFRLNHLSDDRAAAVLQKVAEISKWQSRTSPNPNPNTAAGTPTGSPAATPGSSGNLATGRGVAFCQYENKYAYVAMVAEAQVDRGSGQVTVTNTYVAHDCGLIVNPNGLQNQIEGNVIQGTSRALKEQMTWNNQQLTSLDWHGYPILTFPEVPTVQIALIDHPDKPPLGAGEITTCIVAGAINNAIYDAIGVRLREIPFTPDRVKAALQSA